MTPDRFDDFADVINPNRRATPCWCLSHRLGLQEIERLGGGGEDGREQAAGALSERGNPPGVAAYRDGMPVVGQTGAMASKMARLVMRRVLA